MCSYPTSNALTRCHRSNLLLDQRRIIDEKESSFASLGEFVPDVDGSRHELLHQHHGDEGLATSGLEADDRVFSSGVVQQLHLKGTRRKSVRLHPFRPVEMARRRLAGIRRRRGAMSAGSKGAGMTAGSAGGRAGMRPFVVMTFISHGCEW